MERIPVAAALPGVRRHLSPEPGGERARHHPGRRLVPRLRVRGTAELVRHAPGGTRAAGADLCRRARGHRHHRHAMACRRAAGTESEVRHAEVLQDGELCTAPVRAARQTDRYVSAGRGGESWEPEFTMHGFRYAEISGWPGGPTTRDLEAQVCHSDMRRTGWF